MDSALFQSESWSLPSIFFFPDQVVVWIYSVPTVELRDPINRTANPCLNDLQILWLNHRWASRQHKSLSSSIQLLSSYTDFLIFQIWCNTLTQADVFVFISQVLCCNFGFLQIHLFFLKKMHFSSFMHFPFKRKAGFLNRCHMDSWVPQLTEKYEHPVILPGKCGAVPVHVRRGNLHLYFDTRFHYQVIDHLKV